MSIKISRKSRRWCRHCLLGRLKASKYSLPRSHEGQNLPQWYNPSTAASQQAPQGSWGVFTISQINIDFLFDTFGLISTFLIDECAASSPVYLGETSRMCHTFSFAPSKEQNRMETPRSPCPPHRVLEKGSDWKISKLDNYLGVMKTSLTVWLLLLYTVIAISFSTFAWKSS